MMASPPYFRPTPCCVLIKNTLPNEGPFYPDLLHSTDFSGQMTRIHRDMRYLTDALKAWGPSISTNDLMSFSKMRSTLEHRLLTLKIHKTKDQMQPLDYLFEACRLAALIYLKCILHNFKPVCAILRNLKVQLMNIIMEGEETLQGELSLATELQLQRGALTWVLSIGGILSLNAEEEMWFAKRLVNSTKASDLRSWTDVEGCLKQISWVDSLRSPECISVWRRVEEMQDRRPGALMIVEERYMARVLSTELQCCT